MPQNKTDTYARRKTLKVFTQMLPTIKHILIDFKERLLDGLDVITFLVRRLGDNFP